MSTTATPTRTEWRKKKVDRSKRVAPGATIDEKNIIKTSRRKGAKLTVEQRNKENKSGNKSPKPKPKAEKKVEKVEEEEEIQVEVEEEEPVVEKVEKKTEKPKAEKKVEKKVEQVKTPMQEVTEQVENLQVTEKKKTPTKSRKTSISKKEKEQKKVVSKVITQIVRLGATPKEVGEQRYYRDLKEPMPKYIQMFCDSFVGREDVNYSSSTHKLEEVKFGQEFALEEFEDFKYLKKDDILIGDGDYLIVANNKDTREDFEVCLVQDEDSKPVGPFKISDFLKTLEVSEIEGEEEE
jgi:hypothetical protein